MLNQKLIEGTVHDIYRTLTSNLGTIGKDYGALLNTAGVSMFLYHYGNHFNSNEAIKTCRTLLYSLFNGSLVYSDIPSTVSFCSGLSGTGWLSTYMESIGFWNSPPDLNELDEISFDFFQKAMQRDFFDFLHGASGALFYLANRNNSKRVEHITNSMVEQLLESMYYSQDKLFWEDYDFEKGGKKGEVLNFGLSHGTPAILSILSKLAWSNVANADHVKDVVLKSTETILRNRNHNKAISSYPYNINIHNRQDQNSRLGWCYGDLGVAILLWNIGEALDNERYRQQATDTLVKAATRRDMNETSVRDAGICHGASGIAHIFHVFYKRTGIRTLCDASNFWLSKTINLIEPTSELKTGRVKWHNEAGHLESFALLDGISGVGLVLLSQLSERDLKWDGCLLI